ncbi:hypothetical protein [Pajaroellobacter abortibovis]|uniref:Uncharacterized protein n=1 Tax=Pajaroellobacter abortibovis TaxID=1882918 RepID=A0A1L6MZ29_9BACT|nr:hypothetical protein [Pajaroellobacter abortibovis]APS00782.1 hypothetical protein BCY86_08900 [Pajaroellobacter abortibovis]
MATPVFTPVRHAWPPTPNIEKGRLEQLSTNLGIPEIIQLGEANWDGAEAARVIIWLDETVEDVALRMIDLRNRRIILADHINPIMTDSERTKSNFLLARELDRLARRDSITHALLGVGIYTGQHFSMDWVDQWKETNANLLEVSIFLLDPLLGVGGCYYRIAPKAMNMVVG